MPSSNSRPSSRHNSLACRNPPTYGKAGAERPQGERRPTARRAVCHRHVCKQKVYMKTLLTNHSFRFQVSGFKFQVSSSRFQVSGFKFQVSSSKFQVQRSMFNVQRSKFNVPSSTFQVQRSTFLGLTRLRRTSSGPRTYVFRPMHVRLPSSLTKQRYGFSMGRAK